MFLSSSWISKITGSLLLVLLVVPSSSVIAQQEEEENSTHTSGSDEDNEDNTDSSSLLMMNYNTLREEGQGFYLVEVSGLMEKPDSVKGPFVTLHWWCDLEFSSEDADTNKYGYVGRAVGYYLDSSLKQGSESLPSKKRALSISAVMVPTLGIFEGQFHNTHDAWVCRYWDDGSSTLPTLAWEGHDEGDTRPGADTSAWSSSGTMTKITTETASKYLGMDVADMTPATCSKEYEAAWNATHVPDPIDTSVTDLKETIAQLQADNKELLSRIAVIEASFTANGSGDGKDENPTPTSSSSSPFVVLYEYDIIGSVVKSFMTIAVIVGLIAADFL